MSDGYDLNPNNLAEELRLAGEDMADKDAAASTYEDTRKHIRAKLMLEANCKSINQAEMIAEASDEYRNHIITGINLRQQATRAKVKYETLRVKIELIRSIEATNRAQMGMR